MCFIINHDFYVITFWMHYTLFIIIVIFRRNKLIVIDNWIFYVLHFLRLFMISFKCCLISLKYFLTDSVFLSPLHIISLFTIRLRLQKERLLKKIKKHIKIFLKEKKKATIWSSTIQKSTRRWKTKVFCIYKKFYKMRKYALL